MHKININDPTAWHNLSWDDPVVPDLLKRSDATVARARSAQRKKNDPNFSATMNKVAFNRNQDPEYIEKLQHGVRHNRDNSYQAESNARPEVKEKISKALKGKPKTEEHKEKLKSTTTNRYGNADYETAHKAGLAKRDRPFHAGEYGVFPSRADAARHAAADGLSNAVKKFEAWTKTKPTEYYFLT